MAVYPRELKYGRRWYVGYRDPGGSWVRKGSWDTKRAATIALAEIRTRIKNGQDVPGISGDIRLVDFIDRYFSYCEKIQTPETVKVDRSRIKNLSKYCENNNVKFLSQFTPGLMAAFQEDFLKDHSRRSWNNIVSLIKTMFNRAVEWNLIKNNPIRSAKKLKIEKSFNYFSEDEIRLIINKCPESLKTAIIILVYTGMRRGELWNLHWRDVDFKNRQIIVRPSDGFMTKNRQIRTIPINRTLYEYLNPRRGKPREYVCRPYESIHTIRCNFVKILNELGLTGTLHDLRHTFASMLASRGVPIPAIKELLGHSDISTTMIYSHLSPAIHKESIDKLPEL